MAVSLTATPLPEDAAVRLRLDAVHDAPVPLVAEDYRGQTAGALASQAAKWVRSGNTDGSVSAVNGAVLLKGSATAGGTTFTRTLTGLTVGARYLVRLWESPETWMRLTLAGQTLSVWSDSSSVPGGFTVLRFEFVATATSHALTFTPWGSSRNVYLYGVNVERYATARTIFKTNNSVSDSANWSQGGSSVTGGYRTIDDASLATADKPAGWNHYFPANADYYSSAAGTTATYPANSQSIRRTVTGLTSGRTYTVTLRGGANLYSSENSYTAARWQVGIVGKAWGTVVTGGTATYTFTATATSHAVDVRLVEGFTATGGYGFGDKSYAMLWVDYLLVEDTTPASPVTYSLVSLTRADANGTRPVRLYQGQGLSDGVLVTTDPEVSLTGPVAYSAVVQPSSGGQQQVQAFTDMTGLVTRYRLAPASLPSQGAWYDLATSLTLGRESTSTLAQVINRPDPLVTIGSQTLRAGAVSIFCDDYAMGTALERVFNTGEVVLLRQPDYPGLDMYIVGTKTSLDISEEMTDPRRWVLTVDYTEVAAPLTPLLGSIGWTIAESSARNATLAASRAEFPTVLALLIGPDS